MFSFVRALVRFAGEVMSVTDVVTKCVAIRLDAKNGATLSSAQAVLLLNDNLKNLVRKSVDNHFQITFLRII
jgi:hypothetical protein